jgi:type VI secretion system protein ImpE
MTLNASAERSLRDGELDAALASLQEVVRLHPDDPKPRIFLFQLLCVLGRWERAHNQLNVAATLDHAALATAQVYGDAIRAEMIRAGVFAGHKAPMVLGEPAPWLALLIESSLLEGRGERAASERLRQRGFDEAPVTRGEINGRPFGWIADADSRLGPVLEAVINGRYCWVPFSDLTTVAIDSPTDLRDIVWIPAHLGFTNGDELAALIPVRYPGS